MADCLFCKVVANEIPSYTVYEDGKTRAFLDIMPSVPGHTMVIHKKHGLTILDYNAEELGEWILAVQKVAKALEKTFGTTILSIGMNHGEPAGVKHMHMHLIPRWADDGGKVIQSLVKKEVKEKLENIQTKIKNNI